MCITCSSAPPPCSWLQCWSEVSWGQVQRWLALQHSCPVLTELTFSLVTGLLSSYMSAVREFSDPCMYSVLVTLGAPCRVCKVSFSFQRAPAVMYSQIDAPIADA